MSVRRVEANSGGRCARKTDIICVEVRRLDGSQVHKHFRSHEMTKAKAFAKKTAAEPHPPDKPPPPSTDTLEEYGELWRTAQRPADPTTIQAALKRAYLAVVPTSPDDDPAKDAPGFGKTRLVDITKLRLQALQSKLLDSYARATVELTMHYVKAVMRQAFDDGLISIDPTVRLRMPRRDSLDTNGVVTPDDVPTHAEVLAIIDGAPSQYRWAVALGFGCGFRVGEVLGVTPAQVQLRDRGVGSKGTITVDAQEQRRGRVGPKTWRGVRTVEYPDLVGFYLRAALRGDHDPDVPLLTGARGGRPRSDDFYSRVWRPALKAAGLGPKRYKFHAARHYCVSAMLARGVPITEVAAYVGDAVETISTTYAHWLRDAESMAKGALDKALGPVTDEDAAGDTGEEAGEGTDG